jgi:ribonuclease VapC
MAEQRVYVLDSFAVLAYLSGESGAVAVEAVLHSAADGACRVVLSIINLGEVLYITERSGGLHRAQETLGLLRQLPIEILPADEPLVFAAAHVKANHALAFADAFAVAAALQERGAVLTGDPEFRAVEALVTIAWLEKDV